MAVTLREITSGTVNAVLKLSVAPEQQRFVAPNAVSLAEALFGETVAVLQSPGLTGVNRGERRPLCREGGGASCDGTDETDRTVP
jgi:hypothetical protein